MTNLKEIAAVAYEQVYPNPTIQTPIKVEHFIEAAKYKLAYELWRLSKELKRSEGEWEIPTSLLRQGDIEVKENVADISGLSVFRTSDGETWISNIGGINCECSYLKQTVNLAQIICDDDYLGNGKPYVIIGDKISFPKGSHKATLPIIYASNGEDLNGEIPIDDTTAELVSIYLVQRFSNKLPVDETANDNANT